MSTAANLETISVADYLAGEEKSRTKYEYVNGHVFAMAGARNVHNRIASRTIGSFYRQLENSDCEVYNSDTKVRIRKDESTFFYYPDAMIVCVSNPDDDVFQDQPVVIVEVVSESTRRVDEGEKREHYLSIQSLQAYVLIEQDQVAVRVNVRNEKGAFVETIHRGTNSMIEFSQLPIHLNLGEIYAGIELGSVDK